MTKFFQIAWMSSPATDRLKSSAKKAMPYVPLCRRWSKVSLSCPRSVEEPAFLIAEVTHLSLNGRYEGSTRWWWWVLLMSLLRVWSWGTEQAVNCLLKARRIAFEQEWVFPRRRLKCLVAGSTTCRPACARETSNARVGGAVGKFQEDLPLVSCLLANVSLDLHSFSGLTSSTKTHLTNIKQRSNFKSKFQINVKIRILTKIF